MIKLFKNKKEITQKRAVRIFFIKLFLIIFILHSFFRWTYYRNYTYTTFKDKEVKVSYDEISNPEPNYRYYKRYQVSKTTKSKGFLIVVTNKEKIYKGTWKQKKPDCGCN